MSIGTSKFALHVGTFDNLFLRNIYVVTSDSKGGGIVNSTVGLYLLLCLLVQAKVRYTYEHSIISKKYVPSSLIDTGGREVIVNSTVGLYLLLCLLVQAKVRYT